MYTANIVYRVSYKVNAKFVIRSSSLLKPQKMNLTVGTGGTAVSTNPLYQKIEFNNLPS